MPGLFDYIGQGGQNLGHGQDAKRAFWTWMGGRHAVYRLGARRAGTDGSR